MWKCTQQKLPAWQPVPTPKCVVVSFYILSLVLLGIGFAIYFTVVSVTRIAIDYTDLNCIGNVPSQDTLEVTDGAKDFVEEERAQVTGCQIFPGNWTAADDDDRSKTKTVAFQVEFTLKKAITDEDLYLYYGLDGFHQNIRRYVLSRDEKQLQEINGAKGKGYSNYKTFAKEAKAGNSCKREEGLLANYPPDVKDVDGKSPTVYRYPCGLTARYMFDDEYLMETKQGISSQWEPVAVSESVADIGWYAMEIGSGKLRQLNPAEPQPDSGSNESWQSLMEMWIVRKFPPVSCVQKHDPATGYKLSVPPMYLARKDTGKAYPRVWDCEGYKRKSADHPVLAPIEGCKFTNVEDVDYTGPGTVCDGKADPRYVGKQNLHWGVESGHFMNWMHIAGTKKFIKLWGVIKTRLNNKKDMLKKIVRVTVYSRFPMNRFQGTKEFVLTTKSWLGGRSLGLAWAYLITGGICMVASFYFTYCFLRFPRTVGDIRDLDWSKRKGD